MVIVVVVTITVIHCSHNHTYLLIHHDNNNLNYYALYFVTTSIVDHQVGLLSFLCQKFTLAGCPTDV